jgi:shikimate kinase
MSPESVILVGFMGAGKSVIGRLLARRLGRCFVETDEMIEAREGLSIPEVFATKGEAYFRERETELLEFLKLKRGDVIATGGGFPCGEGRMEALRALGTVVWLSGDFERLYARASRGGRRPMLDGKSKEEIRALYESRIPYYRQAHLVVDTTAGADQVVRRILALLHERERAPS